MISSSFGKWKSAKGVLVKDRSQYPGMRVQEYVYSEPAKLDATRRPAAMYLGYAVFTPSGRRKGANPSRFHYVKPMYATHPSTRAVNMSFLEWRPIPMRLFKMFLDHANGSPTPVEHVDGIGECVMEDSLCSGNCANILCLAGNWGDWHTRRIIYGGVWGMLALALRYPDAVKDVSSAKRAQSLLRTYDVDRRFLDNSNIEYCRNDKLERIARIQKSISQEETLRQTISEEAADALNVLSDKYGIEVEF